MAVEENQISLAYAQRMDEEDPLRKYRFQFHFPSQEDGTPFVYLCGNSLGLQPKATKEFVNRELENWKNLGIEGYFHGKNPWLRYHEYLAEAMAKVVGGKPEEVVVMNTLTVNLHLMMVSFFRPEGKRCKILMEADAFPSDRYAVESQLRFHKLDPKDCLITLKARPGEVLLRSEDIKEVIDQNGDEISLIMLGNTNYYTGQFYNIKEITKWGHEKGCFVGFDCAHGAGNVPLELHDSGCDFAVWCNYKYLNSGPGGMGSAFVHERHHNDPTMPRFEGWWGQNKERRFLMEDQFDPIPTVEAWQLSCTPIMAMAPIWSSLQLFDEAGFVNLRKKSISLTAYLELLVKSLGEELVEIITPSDPEQRGAQLSIRVKNENKSLFDKITEAGVIVDWREPDVIRVAPAPMYNSYEDVFLFYCILKEALTERQSIDLSSMIKGG